jgi:hypothetical protein
MKAFCLRAKLQSQSEAEAPGADVRVSGDEMRLQTFTAHSAGLLYLGDHRLIALTAV